MAVIVEVVAAVALDVLIGSEGAHELVENLGNSKGSGVFEPRKVKRSGGRESLTRDLRCDIVSSVPRRLRASSGGMVYHVLNRAAGRFKSFPIERDDHFLTAGRYVERAACESGMISRAMGMGQFCQAAAGPAAGVVDADEPLAGGTPPPTGKPG